MIIWLKSLLLLICVCSGGVLLNIYGNPEGELIVIGTIIVSSLIIFFVCGFESAKIEYPSAETSGSNQSKINYIFTFIGVAVSGFLLTKALTLFIKDPSSHNKGWLFYISAVFLLIISFWPWRGKSKLSSNNFQKWELVLFAFIAVVTVTFRLYLITSYPFGYWFDESQASLEALKILNNDLYRPVFIADVCQMPALSFYLDALFVWFFKTASSQILAVRVVSTMGGCLAVFVVWLLGRELFGRKEGLLAALFLAISQWHVNFSRFGVIAVFPSLFIPLTLLFFMRAIRKESARDAVIAGVSLGIGLQFYFAMFAIPILLILVFIHQCFKNRVNLLKKIALMTILFMTTAFVYSPIIQYAKTNPGQFNQRMSTVSVIKAGSLSELFSLIIIPSQERDTIVKTLTNTVLAHFRMFHIYGDKNGRHNLPGAPMLDPVTGFFFGIGFLWCIFHFFNPTYSILILWFFANISAGILALDFEAPQGARTFGITPALMLIAAVPAGKIIQFFIQKTTVSLRVIGILVLIPLIGAALSHNWYSYFVLHRYDNASWSSFSTQETLIGKIVKSDGGKSDIYLPASLNGGPTEELILGKSFKAYDFDATRNLPITPNGRGAIIFLQTGEENNIKLIKKLYPDATVEPHGPVNREGLPGNPILFSIHLTEEQVENLSGWETTFNKEGNPANQNKLTKSANIDWGDAPVPVPYVATTNGALRVTESGNVSFKLSSPYETRLILGEEEILHGRGDLKTTVILGKGVYPISTIVEVQEDKGFTSLFWKEPKNADYQLVEKNNMFNSRVVVGGLLGSFFKNATCEGVPEFRELNTQIAHYFHLLPLPRPYCIIWEGSLYAPVSGEYTFGTTSIDNSTVKIDGKEVVTNSTPNSFINGKLSLTQGWHAIKVNYQAIGNHNQIYLYWTPPDGTHELVPSQALLPIGPRGNIILAAKAPATEP